MMDDKKKGRMSRVYDAPGKKASEAKVKFSAKKPKSPVKLGRTKKRMGY